MPSRKPNWNELAEHRETPVDAETPKTTPRTPARRPSAAQTVSAVSVVDDRGGSEPAARAETPRRRLRRIAKHPATYRLPMEVLDLIDDAVDDAASRGERLSKEDAVAEAILAHYGSSRSNG